MWGNKKKYRNKLINIEQNVDEYKTTLIEHMTTHLQLCRQVYVWIFRRCVAGICVPHPSQGSMSLQYKESRFLILRPRPSEPKLPESRIFFGSGTFFIVSTRKRWSGVVEYTVKTSWSIHIIKTEVEIQLAIF